MSFGISQLIIKLLLTPFSFFVSCLIFLFICFIFFTKREKISGNQKMLLIICALICLLYFAFLLWLIIGFGSNAHPKA